MATKTVNTTELKIGDFVFFYGGKFELVECTCDAERAAENAKFYKSEDESLLSRRAFRGKLVSDRAGCSIPNSYFAIDAKHGEPDGELYWVFQGNQRAMWFIEA